MVPSLEELKADFRELSLINEKQEKRVRYFETTTINLVIAYIFFQGLIFMSISQNRNVSCTHSWISFGLSSLVAVIFAVTFKRIIGKWERTKYHYDINFVELDLVHHRIVLLKESQQGSSYNQQPPNDQILKCDMFEVYQRFAFVYLVSLALLAYTICILNACRWNLCLTSGTIKP